MKKSVFGLMAFCAVGIIGAAMYSCTERELECAENNEALVNECDTMYCGRMTVDDVLVTTDSTIEVGCQELRIERKSVSFLRGAQACEHDWDEVELYYCSTCGEYYVGRDMYMKPKVLRNEFESYAITRTNK